MPLAGAADDATARGLAVAGADAVCAWKQAAQPPQKQPAFDLQRVDYSTIAKAVEETALEQLPKRQRPTTGWFALSAYELRAAIEQRNVTFYARVRRACACEGAR